MRMSIEITRVCECFSHEIHVYIYFNLYIYINYLYRNIIYLYILLIIDILQ